MGVGYELMPFDSRAIPSRNAVRASRGHRGFGSIGRAIGMAQLYDGHWWIGRCSDDVGTASRSSPTSYEMSKEVNADDRIVLQLFRLSTATASSTIAVAKTRAG